MEKNVSMEMLLERYQKMLANSARFYPNYYRMPDLKFIVDFFKGIDCKEYYFRDAEKIFFKKADFANLYAPIIENGDDVALFDVEHFEIISKCKCLSLTMKRNDPKSNLAAQRAIIMKQSTPEGIYYFELEDYIGIGPSKYSCNMYFYPGEPLRNVGVTEPIVLFLDEYAVVQNKILSITEEDIPKIANKIYRNGLPYLYKIFKSGGILEITNEDKKYYELTEEDIMSQVIQTSKANEENIEFDSLSTTSSENEVVEQLIILRDMGIELSSEQYAMIDLYERLNSEKFQQYKNNSVVRKEKQKKAREEIVAENERKENWHNSPENPTNKRIEELKHMKRQMEGLEILRNIDASLLSDEQRELLEKGNIFFEMLANAQSEEHEVDTGMSPEIRDWYQKYYANEDGKSRK